MVINLDKRNEKTLFKGVRYMGELIFAGTIIVTGLIIWGLYKLLHIRGPIGAVLRLSWNLACAIMCVIPLFGWMENFQVDEPRDDE